MTKAKIYMTQKYPGEAIPMAGVEKAFQEWFNQGAMEDHQERIQYGSLSQADFVGNAQETATSDSHIFLTASLHRTRAKHQVPVEPRTMDEDPFCEMVARFPKS